ncbi:restriction endonuclease subunit S [Vibrio parahaemolyticus]|nr:restriction endonuclease subunit S [Vibrio parahaemolyticus]EIZ1047698.1 restriction endonuclease subunit S [Vibrio parahaemolyticus]
MGWCKANLENVCELIRGVSFSSSDKSLEPGSGLIACLRTANVQQEVEWGNLWYIPEGFVKREEQLIKKEDILISNANSYELVGKVSRINHLPHKATLGAFISILRPERIISKGYLYYAMLSEDVRTSIRELSSTTTNISNVSISKLKTVQIKVAPCNEQLRIVEKIEELFSELDEGVKELKAAQTKLSQYRQSLLKSAVEGSLTQQWRAENSDQVQETGEKLLARILKQRREQWQQQRLAEFAEKGKTPPKNWQDKYPEPVQPDTTDLPELPKGWVWASLDMLGDIVSGVTKGTKRKAEIAVREVPYLRVANVQRGFLNLDEVKTIPATESDIKKYTLVPGDILFNEGGDRDKLGRGWVWYGEVENCIHQNHVFRMRAFVADLVPELISHHGNTFGKLWFQSAGKQTTNLASINKGILQEFPVPLAPVIEQNKIMELLEEELTLLAKQEEYTLAALTTSEAQRKNILKSAFSGQLVPQDPNDEPASVLLEKIKQERETLAKLPKPRKPSKPKKKVDLMNTLLEVLTAEKDWIDAQDAFQKCGIVDGTSTDRIEEIYTELRRLEKAGKIQIQRQGDFDQLKLIKQDVKED